MTHLITTYGLIIVFGLVAIECAGVQVPGETAMIIAGVLSSQGHYPLWQVIVVGAAAAIIGDNAGYVIGRKGGRKLLERTPIVRDYFHKVLPPSERFFQKHGAKTIFLARFIAVLRVTAAWIAGITHMPWWRFAIFNAAGGIVWAVLVSVVAYQFGKSAADAIQHYGLYALVVIAVLVAAVILVLRVVHRRGIEHS